LVPLCDLSFSTGAEEEKGEAAGSRVTREGPARALGMVVNERRACVGREGPASGPRERRRDIAAEDVGLGWRGRRRRLFTSTSLETVERDIAKRGGVYTVGKYCPHPFTRSRENAATLDTCCCDFPVSPYRRRCLCLHSTLWGIRPLKAWVPCPSPTTLPHLIFSPLPSHLVSPIRPFHPSLHPDIVSTRYIPHSSIPYCSVSSIRVGAACDISSTPG
jgi:hypothetical protein